MRLKLPSDQKGPACGPSGLVVIIKSREAYIVVAAAMSADQQYEIPYFVLLISWQGMEMKQ